MKRKFIFTDHMTQAGKYIKALFLLVVFTMNTLVSSACSFSGFFHSLHHERSSSVPPPETHHPSSTTHHHQDAGMHHEHNTDGSGKDSDCCSDKISAVEKIDKSITRTIETPRVIFATSFITFFTSLYPALTLIQESVFPHLVRWRILATIPDLRIAIQSFQI